MADYRRGNLIEEELERVKRREREIQDEVYRERFEERKLKFDEMRSMTRTSGSRDSSHRGVSYDIAQELEEEREKKRQMAKELEIRERQIERTSELLERQSNMLANLEANRNVIMGQSQSSMYNQQMTRSVYHQSIHTDYQYSQQQQYPPMNPLVAPSPYYQYSQQPNNTLDMYYNPLPALPLPVTGVIEEPAAKKAKTETGVSATEINITDADLKRKNPDLKCTYDKCKQTGHEIADCQLLKKRSLRATCFYCKTEGHRLEQCPKLAKKQEKLKIMVCFNCNTAGHHCKDCPARKKQKVEQEKLKEMVCFNCNTAGHHRKDCPAQKQEKIKEMVCFNCNTAGHHCKDCPELFRPEMTESMKCYRCHSEEHKVQNCPHLKRSKEAGMLLSEMTKSKKCYRCLSEGHKVVNCPHLRKSSKDAADVTKTVGMDEVDNVNNMAVAPSTLNNVTLSNLVSIACSDKALKSSSASAAASNATIKSELVAASSATTESAPSMKRNATTTESAPSMERNATTTESTPSMASNATTIKSEPSMAKCTTTITSALSMANCATTTKSEPSMASNATTTKSAKKRKRNAPSVANGTSSVNNQALTSSGSANSTNTINIVQNTGTITTNPCTVLSNVEAEFTSILTSNPSKNTTTSSSSMSNTNCVTSKEKTVACSTANPVKGHTDFDIAEEMEKFKNNPKHMISMAKYRRHILNLRKAESERIKSTVQALATEKKVDSSDNKVPVKQEDFSSSQSQNYNSEEAQNDDPSPMKESTTEVKNPQLFGITCDVCQFTSKIHSEINTHKQTPQHIKKTELCETGCMMCGKVKFKTFTEYTSHKSEKLHKALLLKKGQISTSKLAKIANKVAGIEYVVPVSGFFCKLCKKFYNEESYAKDDHCRSKEHHEKIGEIVSAKYETAIRAKVLELYKLVKKHIKNEKEVPARFFKVLSAADFTNLKPLTSAKSPRKDQPKSKEIPQTVSKNADSSLSMSQVSGVTEVLKEAVEEVKTNDISDACDASDASVSMILKQSCDISNSEYIKVNDSDVAPAKCKDISKTSDNHIRNDSSTPDSENTMKSSGAESENKSDKVKDVIKSKQEEVDAGAAPTRPSEKDPEAASIYSSGTKQDEVDDLVATKSKCEEIELDSESVGICKDVHDQSGKTAAMQYDTAAMQHNTAAMQYDKADDENSSDTVVYDVLELEQMETEDGPLIQIDTNDSKIDINPQNNLAIKNVTSLKSLNVNFDQSSSRLKTSDLQEAGRVLETGGSTIPAPVCSSSTTASLTEKKPQSLVLTEKMDSTDTDADLLLSDDDEETNLSGDCDSDMDLNDSLFNFSLPSVL